MPAPAVVAYQDDTLGKIWANPTAPITFTSSDAWQTLLIIDNTLEPVASATISNPWFIKWRIGTSFITRKYIDPTVEPRMEMELQYSDDLVNWSLLKQWGLVPYEGMIGRLPYHLLTPVFPRYVRLYGKIYPKKDGSVTSVTFLAGMEDFAFK